VSAACLQFERDEQRDGELWQTHMLAGEFELAWQASDRIRARNAPDPHRFWDGESLAGKRVIVRCLHGLGDTVQMLRYAPALAALTAEITFELPPRMLPIARCFAGVRNVLTWTDAPPAWDSQIEIMELPYIFRTTLAELPLAERYLQVPVEPMEAVAKTMSCYRGAGRRIGLVHTAADWNPSRSIPFDLLAPLLGVADCEFWSLEQAGQSGLRNATQCCGDGLLALVATIANLDLVITVDTLAAHVAGALGRPCWLLLQHAADWRWMSGREDSPWYPSLRLCRQPKPGDWKSLIAAVCERLKT
jgi:hypothetical protein